MDHRLHHGLRSLATAGERPRNPFTREADAFRVALMIIGAGALVVGVTLLTRPLVGAIVGLGLILVGAWSVWRWARAYLESRRAE